jgi:hypothetical protein
MVCAHAFHMHELLMKGPTVCQFMQILYSNKVKNEMFPETKLCNVVGV